MRSWQLAVPGRWRPYLAWLAGSWVGRLLTGTAAGLIRIQIFDRSMTLAAQAFTQQARTLAAARGINCVALDYDALRGMEPNTPTLF